MASTIANLTKTSNGGYKGTLTTLSTKAPIEFQPNTRKSRDEEPDFRIVATHNGFELGAAWTRKSRSSDGDYVSASLSAPEFNGKLYANVAPAPGGKEGEFVLIWNGRD
jgi:uncharacterized protein (DUF736 family)